jgi:hypothetical protein
MAWFVAQVTRAAVTKCPINGSFGRSKGGDTVSDAHEMKNQTRTTTFFLDFLGRLGLSLLSFLDPAHGLLNHLHVFTGLSSAFERELLEQSEFGLKAL